MTNNFTYNQVSKFADTHNITISTMTIAFVYNDTNIALQNNKSSENAKKAAKLLATEITGILTATATDVNNVEGGKSVDEKYGTMAEYMKTKFDTSNEFELSNVRVTGASYDGFYSSHNSPSFMMLICNLSSYDKYIKTNMTDIAGSMKIYENVKAGNAVANSDSNTAEKVFGSFPVMTFYFDDMAQVKPKLRGHTIDRQGRYAHQMEDNLTLNHNVQSDIIWAHVVDAKQAKELDSWNPFGSHTEGNDKFPSDLVNSGYWSDPNRLRRLYNNSRVLTKVNIRVVLDCKTNETCELTKDKGIYDALALISKIVQANERFSSSTKKARIAYSALAGTLLTAVGMYWFSAELLQLTAKFGGSMTTALKNLGSIKSLMNAPALLHFKNMMTKGMVMMKAT